MRSKLFKTSTLAVLAGFFMNTSVYAMENSEITDESYPTAAAVAPASAALLSEPSQLAEAPKRLLTHIQIMPFLYLLKQKLLNSEMNIAKVQADLEAFKLTLPESDREQCNSAIKEEITRLEAQTPTARTISPESTKVRFFLPDKNYLESDVMGCSVILENPINLEKPKTTLFKGHPYFDRALDFTQTSEVQNGQMYGILQVGFTTGEIEHYYLQGNLFYPKTKPTDHDCDVAPLVSEITGNTLNITLIRPQSMSRQFFPVGQLPQ
ncbi:MAG TPA: hypothetical protein PLY23_09245 [Alphaproteobacteria bacterium]|nr:hypothetical protein [Alphaproteobacteria bacterium]HQS94798.1 hypothetical protein [Alphaproteobacteria bacterium]